MPSKGSFGDANGLPGDLLIKISVKPDKYFHRDGYDIYTTAYIPISQAVMGGKVEVKTLYSNTSVPVKPGTEDGEKYQLRG